MVVLLASNDTLWHRSINTFIALKNGEPPLSLAQGISPFGLILASTNKGPSQDVPVWDILDAHGSSKNGKDRDRSDRQDAAFDTGELR